MATELLWNDLDYPWSYAVTATGRIFFVNDLTKRTSWLHPSSQESVQTGYRKLTGLPKGWEQCVTPEGAIYYIDHTTCQNTFFHPVTGESQAADQKPRLDVSPTSETSTWEEDKQSTVSSAHNDSLPDTPPKSAIRPSPTIVKKPGSNRRSVVPRPPSARRLPHSPVSIRGWLYRQDSTGLRHWRRRWCLLADYCLYCYKDEKEEFCDCSVLLPSYKVNPCSRDDTVSRHHAFKIEHDNMQTIYFAAETKSELQRWMNSLSLATILQTDPRASQPVPPHKRALDENSNSLTDRANDGYGTFSLQSNPTHGETDNLGPREDRNGNVQNVYNVGYVDEDRGSVYRTSGIDDLRAQAMNRLQGRYDDVTKRRGDVRRDDVIMHRDDNDDSNSNSVFESGMQPQESMEDLSDSRTKPLQAKEALRLWHLSSDATPRQSMTTPPNFETTPRNSSAQYQHSPVTEHLYENIPAEVGFDENAPERPPIPGQCREAYIRGLATLAAQSSGRGGNYENEAPSGGRMRDYENVAEAEGRQHSDSNVFQFPESPTQESDRPSGRFGDTSPDWISRQNAVPDQTASLAENDDSYRSGIPVSERDDVSGGTVPRSPYLSRPTYPPRQDKDFNTIKEDPAMADTDVLETRSRLRKTYSVSALNGYKPRLSITAADLMGKSHEELVLLLIQLRRDRADLAQSRDQLKDLVDQRKEGEKRYRSIASTHSAGPGGIDAAMEDEHDEYLSIKARLAEAENQLDVHTPLVNLVDNLVKMGSLYNGQNNLLFSQYKRHLLNPGQAPSSKSMLDFSRQMQEAKLQFEQEHGIEGLREEEVDLNEKTEILHKLDARLQELSVLVRSLTEDKHLLERALAEVSAEEKRFREDPSHMAALAADRRVLERQLSDVLQQLADQSLNLEEVEAENHKVEMEVMLLRSRIFDLSKSRSLPCLSGESYQAKQQILGDMTRVQDLMNGLTERGQQLNNAMTSLRKSNGDLTKENDPTRPLRSGTYHETDLNTMQTRDIALEKTKRKAQQPNKPTIKRSYSEREIRPDKNEFPPRMERARSKNLRDLKRQSERRGRGQRYDPPTVQRSQSLPRFYTRAESPEPFRPTDLSFGSTRTLPVDFDRRAGSFSPQLRNRNSGNPGDANRLNSVRGERSPSNPDFMVRSNANSNYGQIGERHSHSGPRGSTRSNIGPQVTDKFQNPRGYHSMSEYPRERYSYNQPRSPDREGPVKPSRTPDEPLSPAAHRRPTGYRDVNQMSPIVHRASLPSPNSVENDPQFSPRSQPDLRQKPPSPKPKRANPSPAKSVIPERVLSKIDMTEITADSPSVIQQQQQPVLHREPNSGRSDPFSHLRPTDSLPRGDTLKLLKSQLNAPDPSARMSVRSNKSVQSELGRTFVPVSPDQSFQQDPFAHLRPPSYSGSRRSLTSPVREMTSQGRSLTSPVRDGVDRTSWASGYSNQQPNPGYSSNLPREDSVQRHPPPIPPKSHVLDPRGQGQGHDNRSYGYLPPERRTDSLPRSYGSNYPSEPRPVSATAGLNGGPQAHDFDPRARSQSDGTRNDQYPGQYGANKSVPPVPGIRLDSSFRSDHGYAVPHAARSQGWAPNSSGYQGTDRFQAEKAHDSYNQRPRSDEIKTDSPYATPNRRSRENQDSNRQSRKSDLNTSDPRRRSGSRERGQPIGGGRVGSYSPRMAARHRDAQRSSSTDALEAAPVYNGNRPTSSTTNSLRRGRSRERPAPEQQREAFQTPTNVSQQHSAPNKQHVSPHQPHISSHPQHSVPQSIPMSLRNGRGRNMTIHSSEPSRLELRGINAKDDYDSGSDIELRHARRFSPARQIQRPASGGWGPNYVPGDTLIDREVLMAPEKVEIPERYVPESEIDDVSDNERYHRQEKADKLKRMLSRQSLQDWRRGEIDVPSRHELHEKVDEERKRREDVLELRQELAQQVKQVSKQVAVAANERERRKTWSSSDTRTGAVW